jgi:hypothetical protein
MSDKNDSYMSEDKGQNGWEWHLEFNYTPHLPCPFPIVQAGTRPKHDAVGHLSRDGRVHVYCTAIIEQLVRAGLRARVAGKNQNPASESWRAGVVRGLGLRRTEIQPQSCARRKASQSA